MKNLLEKILFCDFTTEKKLAAASEFVVTYKNHSIAFGLVPCKGYTVRVYENEGSKRIGDFALRGVLAGDGEAVVLARKWAQAVIDEEA